MAVDQIRKLQAAEDLLKQGRSDEALTELQRLAEESPNDLLTLNRMGDMLSRQGRVEDALVYYREIADKFAAAGYLHKAVAILKKMLRLAPESTDVLATIGRLYIRQKLPVEGGRYLLSAADRFLEAKEFAQARAVYEELVVTDPQNPLHRARLAETMAAEGDAEAAGRELVRLADSLRSEGRWEDAERSYSRAGELCPDWHDPTLGVSACLMEQGKPDDALTILEEAVANGQRALLGELVVRSEMASRSDRVDELLKGENGMNVAPETFEHLFVSSLEAGTTAALWKRFDPVFASWPKAGATERAVQLYESLVGIEEGGHVAALERLFTVLESSPDREAFVPAMERLFRGLRQKSMDARATAVEGWIRESAPQSVILATAEAPGPAAPVAEGQPSIAAEAPPVPLTRADKEFVTGRLTQAEILEKYSLVDQAVQQIRDVATRFPGHVDAQKRLVKLLRQSGDKKGHAEALAGLAIACRAAGNVQAARNSAAEAIATTLLDSATKATLEVLGLVGDAATAPVSVPSATSAAGAKTPKPSAVPAKKAAAAAPIALSDVDGAEARAVVAGSAVAEDEAAPDAAKPKQKAKKKAKKKETAAPAAAAPKVEAEPASADDEIVVDLDGDDGIVIDLDGDDEIAITADAVLTKATAAPPAPVEAKPVEAKPVDAAPVDLLTEAAADDGAKPPGEDMLEEVEFYLGQERVEEARQRIDTLHALGYHSPRLETLAVSVAKLEAELSAMPTADAPPQVSVEDPPLDAGFDLGVDDDLSTIAAALEGEINQETAAVEPDAGHEQSVEDVFAAFREKVNEEIGGDDYRTHYDLGIGYKEMGLLEEALGEFEVSLKCPELEHESHVMMGIIRRELGRLEEALDSYRAATAGSDPAQTVPLRYDLAELLQEIGDHASALEVLREVLEVDPGFRDVQERIATLEAAPPTG